MTRSLSPGRSPWRRLLPWLALALLALGGCPEPPADDDDATPFQPEPDPEPAELTVGSPLCRTVQIGVGQYGDDDDSAGDSDPGPTGTYSLVGCLDPASPNLQVVTEGEEGGYQMAPAYGPTSVSTDGLFQVVATPGFVGVR